MEAQLSQNNRQNQKPPAGVFIAATIVIFFTSLSAADSVGFVPYYIDGSSPTSERSVSLASLPELGESTDTADTTRDITSTKTIPVTPVRIKIDAINLDLPVLNTPSHDLAVLDEALHDGPVRYVDSAKLNEPGNMLIFAHSSHLPVVHNQMFKAFNHISELQAGDSITVEGKDGKSYIYTVTTVRQTKADEEVINLSTTNGTKLTLSTCDTLTSKSSRFVVEADFVGVVGE